MGLVRQINVGSDVGYLWPYTPKAVSVTNGLNYVYKGDDEKYKKFYYTLVGPIDGIYYVYNKYWGDNMSWFDASKLAQVIEVKFENDMCRPYAATIMPKTFWETLKNNSVNWDTEEKPSNPWFWTSTLSRTSSAIDFYVDWNGSDSSGNGIWSDHYAVTNFNARLGFYV